MKYRNLLLILLANLLLISCFKDEDDVLRQASNEEIQDFIYRGLNYFYLYKSDIPELANDYFDDEGAKSSFIRSFSSPESLFDYLISPQDRFSRLFDDYVAIENALSGVSLSNGMEFGLVYYPGTSSNVFGYVRYVLPNSSASEKGLKRGDIFTTVNGTQLTDSNYNQLLSTDVYTIGLSLYDGTNFQLTGENVELVKSQYDENPVHLSTILNIGGRKIGYLMYTSFTRRYDNELNNVFGQFKSEGITDLVLDLRYNSGGSVETAVDLASMITGQFNGQLFYSEIWNEDRQPEYAGNGVFDNTISNGTQTNSLNLNEVYILTTRNSASASELVINGLNSYIHTVQVGDTTTGKFQASFLMYDAPAPYFSKNQASPHHTYAMLPLVFKTANKAGHTDYVDGLFPTITQQENFFNLGELGNPTEPLLATALANMGVSSSPNREFHFFRKELFGSEKQKPLHGMMLIKPEE